MDILPQTPFLCRLLSGVNYAVPGREGKTPLVHVGMRLNKIPSVTSQLVCRWSLFICVLTMSAFFMIKFELKTIIKLVNLNQRFSR
jgi:hypothetical protein